MHVHVHVHVHVRLRLFERGEKVLQVVGLRLFVVPNMLVYRLPQRLPGRLPLIVLRLPGPFCAALFEDMRAKHVPVTLGTAVPPGRVMDEGGDQPRVQLEGAREERLERPSADALCKQAVVATEEELCEQELQRTGQESCTPVLHLSSTTSSRALSRRALAFTLQFFLRLDGCCNPWTTTSKIVQEVSEVQQPSNWGVKASARLATA